jgi:hypothetical protein
VLDALDLKAGFDDGMLDPAKPIPVGPGKLMHRIAAQRAAR